MEDGVARLRFESCGGGEIAKLRFESFGREVRGRHTVFRELWRARGRSPGCVSKAVKRGVARLRFESCAKGGRQAAFRELRVS